MRRQTTTWVKWLGSLIALLALITLFVQFRESANSIKPEDLYGALDLLLVATVGYFLCGILLGFIWWLSVKVAGGHAPRIENCIYVHMASQLGKYLPGNVVHFAARHVGMRRFGVGHSSLVASGVLESLALVLAALLLAMNAIGPAAEALFKARVSASAQLVVISIMVLLAVFVWILARRWNFVSRSMSAALAGILFALATISSVLFFLGAATCFWIFVG